MNEAGPVTVREAMSMLMLCWAVCGVTWLVLSVVDDSGLPAGAPVVIVLTQWFWNRHRRWAAGALATVTGSATVFLVTDALRPSLGRPTADSLAVAAGLPVALIVFTAASRLRAH